MALPRLRKRSAATATTAAAESSQSVAAETGMTAAQATEALNGHADKPADAPTYQDAANAINALAKARGAPPPSPCSAARRRQLPT